MRDVQKIEHTLNIRAGLPVLSTKYGLSMDEYDYLDLAVGELNDIRNFGIRPYKSFIKLDEKGYMDMPCNVDLIEAIVNSNHGEKAYPDREILVKRTEHNDTLFNSVQMRSLLAWPIRTLNRVDGQLSFKLESDNRIFIYDEAYWGTEICIAYTGYITDEEGFPMITRKQSNALAAIAARNIVMKAALSGDKLKAQMLQVVSQEASKLKQSASIPETISDKELDEVMDAHTAFNRKRYGRPNKYSR